MKKVLLFSVFALSAVLTAQSNIPAGTVIPVMLNTSVDAKSARVGQTLTAKIEQDVPLYNGAYDTAKIKAGTRVIGEVLAITAAGNSQPATITLRFDKVDVAGHMMPVLTDLRALASPLEVDQAQTEISEQDWGSTPPWSQTLTQIGGDVVYRETGKVYYGSETVGRSVYAGGWGVLSQVSSSPRNGCRGAIDGNNNPQALWVFSHNACGVYGYDAVITDAGRTNPEGRIVLASKNGDLKLRSGSALLLRVNGSGNHPAQSDVASQ